MPAPSTTAAPEFPPASVAVPPQQQLAEAMDLSSLKEITPDMAEYVIFAMNESLAEMPPAMARHILDNLKAPATRQPSPHYLPPDITIKRLQELRRTLWATADPLIALLNDIGKMMDHAFRNPKRISNVATTNDLALSASDDTLKSLGNSIHSQIAACSHVLDGLMRMASIIENPQRAAVAQVYKVVSHG